MIPPPPPSTRSFTPMVAPRPEADLNLPTMIDLDRLQSQLDTIDQTLADLNQVGA